MDKNRFLRTVIGSLSVVFCAATVAGASTTTLPNDTIGTKYVARANAQSQNDIMVGFDITNNGFSTQYDTRPGRAYKSWREIGTADASWTNLYSFCIQPFVGYVDPSNYRVASSNAIGLDDRQTDLLDRLFSNLYTAEMTKDYAVSFGAAVWEITTEASDTLDIRGGNFQLRADTGYSLSHQARVGSVLDVTNTWLSQLNDDAQLQSRGNWGLTYMKSVGYSQDFVIPDPSPVPLPAAAGFLLLGCGAIAAMRKRPATKA